MDRYPGELQSALVSEVSIHLCNHFHIIRRDRLQEKSQRELDGQA